MDGDRIRPSTSSARAGRHLYRTQCFSQPHRLGCGGCDRTRRSVAPGLVPPRPAHSFSVVAERPWYSLCHSVSVRGLSPAGTTNPRCGGICRSDLLRHQWLADPALSAEEGWNSAAFQERAKVKQCRSRTGDRGKGCFGSVRSSLRSTPYSFWRQPKSAVSHLLFQSI